MKFLTLLSLLVLSLSVISVSWAQTSQEILIQAAEAETALRTEARKLQIIELSGQAIELFRVRNQIQDVSLSLQDFSTPLSATEKLLRPIAGGHAEIIVNDETCNIVTLGYDQYAVASCHPALKFLFGCDGLSAAKTNEQAFVGRFFQVTGTCTSSKNPNQRLEMTRAVSAIQDPIETSSLQDLKIYIQDKLK